LFWFVTFVLIVALLANASFAPRHVPWRLTFIYFMPSWIGRLFALPLSLLSAVGAALLVATDSGTWAAAGLFMVAALLFANAHRCSHRGGRALYAKIASILPDSDLPPAPLWAGIWPLSMGRSGTLRQTNLSYGPDRKRNLLDIVRPVNLPAKPMPILIHIHGGAWVIGNKGQQAKPLIHHMAKSGWLCVDANYRLGPAHRFPDMVTDVLNVIRWVREHAQAYGGDPNFIAITGGSAGGHLACLVALVHDQRWLKPGFETADCSVNAAVPLYFPMDLRDRHGLLGGTGKSLEAFMARNVMPADWIGDAAAWDKMSPIAQVRADAPPMLMIDAGADNLVPWQSVEIFDRELREAGAQGSFPIVVPDAQHAFDGFASALAHYHVNAVRTWLESVRADRESLAVERGAPGVRSCLSVR
jgi:acetyl esterase/lipase